LTSRPCRRTAGDLGPDAEQFQQRGGGLLDQRADLRVQLGDLRVQHLVASSQPPQRGPGRGQWAGQIVAGPQPDQGA
jgi:hypothetical protein